MREETTRLVIIHPADAGLEPTTHKYHLQYKRWRWQRAWQNVRPGMTRLPPGHLRMLREDIYRVPEGFQGTTKNLVIPSGTYTRYVLLGTITRDQYDHHNGRYAPEPTTRTSSNSPTSWNPTTP